MFYDVILQINECHRCRILSLNHKGIRLCSHLVTGHGARIRFSPGTREHTVSSRTHARIRARCPCPSTKSRPCTRAQKGTWVFWFPMSEQGTNFGWCPGARSRAQSVKKLCQSYVIKGRSGQILLNYCQRTRHHDQIFQDQKL